MNKLFHKLVVLVLFCFLPQQSLSAKSSSDSLASQKSITLDFKKIAVRELLQFIAEAMNCNIIMSETVMGTISVNLRAVTWEQAFNTVLDMTGLVKKENRNILLIGTPAEFASHQKNLDQATFMRTVKISLHHTDVNQVFLQLKTQSNILSPVGTATPNNQNNSLWIKESSENLPVVLDFVHQLDLPDKQILITAKVVNIDDSSMNELGVRLSSFAIHQDRSHLQFSFPEMNNNNFNLAILSLAQNQLLKLELDALEKNGQSHLIADPKIITLNRHTANIEAGEEIPYQEKTASGATNVNFKKAALALKVTPTVLPDNRIILELEINQNKISSLTINGTPAIQTQELKTQVIIHNDECVLLGGIFETECTKVEEKMPVLGHIPLVGQLFKHTEKEQARKELLIMVSPHLLTPYN